MLEEIRDELLLPGTELGILETSYVEDRDLAAADIAEELDCSYQLVGKRGKIMEERGLVSRKMDRNRRKFSITKNAVESYFIGNEARKLKVTATGLQ
jgi:DNA-binding MarR family transcriptional regulator